MPLPGLGCSSTWPHPKLRGHGFSGVGLHRFDDLLDEIDGNCSFGVASAPAADAPAPAEREGEIIYTKLKRIHTDGPGDNKRPIDEMDSGEGEKIMDALSIDEPRNKHGTASDGVGRPLRGFLASDPAELQPGLGQRTHERLPEAGRASNSTEWEAIYMDRDYGESDGDDDMCGFGFDDSDLDDDTYQTASGEVGCSSGLRDDFDEEERAEIKKAFDRYDTKKTGRLDENAVACALDALGLEPEEEVMRYKGNREFDFEEFLKIAAHLIAKALDHDAAGSCDSGPSEPGDRTEYDSADGWPVDSVGEVLWEDVKVYVDAILYALHERGLRTHFSDFEVTGIEKAITRAMDGYLNVEDAMSELKHVVTTTLEEAGKKEVMSHVAAKCAGTEQSACPSLTDMD